MSKQDTIELVGIVIEHIHDLFRIRLDNEHGQEVKARLSGKMRLNKINLMPGDYVKLEVSPYDITLGRITSRLKQDKRSAATPTEDQVYVEQRQESAAKAQRNSK